MAVLGLSCNVSAGRLTSRGVVIDDDGPREVFLHNTTASEDEALQLRSLENALATRLADLSVDAVVVRASDHHANVRVTDVVAKRLRGEGVLLATARAHVARVQGLSGREIGDMCNSSKAEVEAHAASLLNAAAKEATSAALAAGHL